MSENLLLPLFTLWLLCVGCFLKAATDKRRFAWGAAAAISAVWLWAAHGRMIVVVGMVCAHGPSAPLSSSSYRARAAAARGAAVIVASRPARGSR
jgi:hypothetical protein